MAQYGYCGGLTVVRLTNGDRPCLIVHRLAQTNHTRHSSATGRSCSMILQTCIDVYLTYIHVLWFSRILIAMSVGANIMHFLSVFIEQVQSSVTAVQGDAFLGLTVWLLLLWRRVSTPNCYGWLLEGQHLVSECSLGDWLQHSPTPRNCGYRGSPSQCCIGRPRGGSQRFA